jgi:hypothetical protein
LLARGRAKRAFCAPDSLDNQDQAVEPVPSFFRLDQFRCLTRSTRESGVAPLLQAFGVISYEDETKTYRMRAFNDGRFLEANVRLLEEGKGMAWGFALGEINTKSVMRINQKDEWTELHEIIIGSQPPKRLMEIAVRRQK